VIVLEKDTIGSGSTGKCGGGISQQFSAEVDIKLALESLEFFKHFEEETGHTADFRQIGWLHLFTTGCEKDLQASRHDVTLQRKLGGEEVHFLSPKEAKELAPEISTEGLIGARYCPTDAVADPYSVVQGYASAARRLGVKIYEGTEVIGIKVDGGRVRGVLLKDGQIESPLVVNAGGPWANQIGRIVGIDVPVKPEKRPIFYTAPTDQIGKRAPYTFIDTPISRLGIRREGRVLRFGMRNPDAPESLDTTPDWDYLPATMEVVVRWFPFLSKIGIARADAGLYECSPDESAILGRTYEIGGFCLACGLSGHGFMQSPAVGRIMAEYITGKEHSPAISLLSLDRFKGGVNQIDRLD